ncbi:MAG: hypothetical protein HN348_28980, partial [Proteobacteria bacterium]|nr:hypothetical protein [Pseudomonadota bacterium]
APKFPIGDGVLDRVLEVHADYPEQVQQLFDDEVRAALKTLIKHWPDVVVTDRAVRVFLRSQEASSAKLMRLVNNMMALSTSLDEARVHVSPAETLAGWVDQWGEMAARMGLDLEPWLPALTGSLDGRRVAIAPQLVDEGEFLADLSLFFRPHREIGLRIYQQTEPDGYRSVGQDIQVKHPEFDDAFVIKGYDHKVIIKTLTESVRRELLAINALAPIEVEDRGLHVSNLPMDPAQLEPLVQRACAIAEGLGW